MIVNEFPTKIVDLDQNGNIVEIGTKTLYNLDGKKKLTDWIREPIKNIKEKIEWPNFKSGLNIDESGNAQCLKNSFGEIVCDNNMVMSNDLVVCILPGKPKNLRSPVSILKENIERALCAYAARRLITSNWIIDGDAYMPPNEQHEKFQQFNNDAIIYSLFESMFNITSLRNIQYHNKTWNIRNNFFWCSNSWIKALAELYNNEQVYSDLIQYSTDPYVYTLLGQKMIKNKEPFSKTALDVLSKASHLLETTFPYRNEFNNEHPEYQVNNWDCGYYQLKPMWKKYKEKEFKEFRELYLTFRDELKPLVYELGFLKE